MEQNVYKEGYMAYEQGISILNNPYERLSVEHEDWKEGYLTAARIDDAWDEEDL